MIKLKGELCFGGGWAPKLTKGPYNSSNWAQDPMKVWKLSWRISSFSSKMPFVDLEKKN